MNKMTSPYDISLSTTIPSIPGETVAVIAVRGRFPGARSAEALWQNLRDGVEAISFFSKEELALAGIDASALGYPGFVPAGAILDDVDMFDAQFFGFNARDAELMDPQQRLFMECAWEAMEEAGYDTETYQGAVGVFAGCDMSTYMYNIWSMVDQIGYVDGMQLAVGNDKDHLTTHASYKMNLRGPSVCVQTACSTSLVAVAMAVRSLLARECDIAMAGGVAINVPQRKGYFYQPGGIVSPDGHCRTFDATAQGTVIGSGIGLVVLKRLSEALADGDRVLAVIKGIGLNNDGSAKVGYHAPSVDGQAQCIRMAQKMAGVSAETITLIEAHGTATALGDPIEIAALTQAFRETTARRQFCAIGSIKSNLGHLASAAGVAGLIKAVLALRHKELPPSIHYEHPNPQIDFPASPFFVNSKLAPWRTEPGVPRRAGVSSFGIGGTNAHVVLEEAPPALPSGPSRPWQPLLIAARTPAALERATDNLADWLREHPEANLADVAFVQATGRKAFARRRAAVVPTGDVGEAVRILTSRDEAQLLAGAPEIQDRPVVFMFPGQGTQYSGMGRALYAGEPTFRIVVDYCADQLRPLVGEDLRELLFASPERRQAADEMLRRTRLTQPALFTIEYALAALWIEWGVWPAAMIGHSIGEWVAATVAGVIAPGHALRIVAERARLMDSMPAGAMLSLPLSEGEVKSCLTEELSLASVNAPAMSVVSGPTAAVEALAKRLSDAGILTRALHTSHAFHSQMMQPIVDDFIAAVRRVPLSAPAIPFLSNVSGTWITAEQATDPSYWGDQLRRTVRFADGVTEIARSADCIWIECGPGQALSVLARQSLKSTDTLLLSSLSSAQEEADEQLRMLSAATRLWASGNHVDWQAVYRHERRQRLPLPTYPFERASYWVGPSERPLAEATSGGQPASAGAIEEWFFVPTWLPRAPTPLPKSLSPCDWLIFDDGSGLGEQLAALLASRGNRTLRIVADATFNADTPGLVRLNPDNAADYHALADVLKERHLQPRHIAHLWLLPKIGTPQDADSFYRLQPRGFFSLIWLVQAFSRAGFIDPMTIAIVGTELAAPIGDEELAPMKSPALGIARAVPQEFSNIGCRVIDVALAQRDEIEDERLLERIVAEMVVEPFAAMVAIRKGRRWVQSYEPLPMQPPVDRAPRLRDGGVYVITGGYGNIALTFADVLAERAKARIALIGRSPMPPREEWPSIAADPASGALGRRLARLLSIEAKGAEVLALQADVADEAQMRQAFALAEERFGTIHGVIHGAGNVSTGFTPIADITPAVAASHFRPKVDGGLIVARLVRDRRPDFVMTMSSLSAVLAGLTLGAYGSANLFLDALSAQQATVGTTPWISVNWDAWAFPEAGSAAPGVRAIYPEEGADAFLRILDRAPQQVVVSVTPLQPRLDKWLNVAAGKESQQKPGKQALHARPSLTSQYVAPQTETEKLIAEVWQNLLGVAPIGIHDRFFELGGHSLLAIQVTARLKESFRMEIPVSKIFEAPTISETARWVDENRAQAAVPVDVDEAKLSEVLAEVESMSDEEIAAMLEKEV